MIKEREDDLEKLLNQLADGMLAEDVESQLSEILRTDPAARQQYRQFMTLHADLQWDYAVAAVMRPNTASCSRRQLRQWKGRRKGLWATAVVLLVVITAGLWFSQRSRDGSQADRLVVGRLTRLTGVVQITDRGRVQEVSQDVDLRTESMVNVTGLAGLALLRLDDGTEISLTGETRVTCMCKDGQMSITVHQGQLSANVTRQPPSRPLLIRTPNAEIAVIGTRFAVSTDADFSELGVRQGDVRFRRLSDGETIEVKAGEYAVASRRSALKAIPWPASPDRWREDFVDGLPDGWRFGQWVDDGKTGGAVRAARQFALDGHESKLFRVTLPKQWTRGLFKVQDDSYLTFTYKMKRPGWFHIMMGARSDDLNPSHAGNYELQSNYWEKAPADQWQTIRVPLSAFRKNQRGVQYSKLPLVPPRAGDVAYLLWFNTGDVDRGLVIDQIAIGPEDPDFLEKTP